MENNKKYLLINTETQLKTICSKVVVHGFDYYLSDEEIKDVRPYKGRWHLEKGNILNQFPTYLTDLSECKLIIATNNPNINAKHVENQIIKIAGDYMSNQKPAEKRYGYVHYLAGYVQALETYTWTDDDIKAAIKYGINLEAGNINTDFKKFKNDFEQFKSEQPIKVYYK